MTIKYETTKWSPITTDALTVVPARYALKKVDAMLKKAKFTVMCQGDFTVVLIRFNKVYVVGVAKRNPRDEWNGSVAGRVAFVRAYRNFVSAVAEAK